MISPPNSQSCRHVGEWFSGKDSEAARCSIKGRKQATIFSRWQVFFQPHPGTRPIVQIAAIGGNTEAARARGGGLLGSFRLAIFRAMELITILNHCHRHRGFVYQHARFSPDQKSIEVAVRPRAGLGGDLFGVPPAGTGLRSSSRAPL